MSGGRPRTSTGRQELRAFAEQLHRACGGRPIADVVRSTGIAVKSVYAFFRAERLPSKAEAQALAKVLGAEVMAQWREAKAAVERAQLATREAVVVRSWDDLPEPEPALAEILQAQLAVADRFPYTLLGVDAPKVSSLYVPEVLSWKNPSGPDTGPATVTTALNKHRNILITAEPGGGKTMAARRLVHRIAARWLRKNGTDVPLSEPVAALYLSAVDIVPGRPWAEAVTDAVVSSGRFYARPDPALFAQRAQGVRWLMVIDGLDEIADRDDRLKILQLLGELMDGSSPYLFVLVSRPLPDEELRLLGPKLPRFALGRFDAERLRMFSERWFTGREVPDDTADRFLAAIDTADLAEVVAVPLFATIAAAVAESPDDLPRSRLDLYERFVEELLEASRPDYDRTPYAAWLRSRRSALVEHLAQSYLANGVVRVEAAERWANRMRPQDLPRPRTAVADLRHCLVETGVVTLDDDVVRFPHKSVAEYLTARARAARIPADFPGLKEHLDENEQGAQRNLMVLTVAAWTRLPGHDAALLFRHPTRGREPAAARGRPPDDRRDSWPGRRGGGEHRGAAAVPGRAVRRPAALRPGRSAGTAAGESPGVRRAADERAAGDQQGGAGGAELRRALRPRRSCPRPRRARAVREVGRPPGGGRAAGVSRGVERERGDLPPGDGAGQRDFDRHGHGFLPVGGTGLRRRCRCSVAGS